MKAKLIRAHQTDIRAHETDIRAHQTRIDAKEADMRKRTPRPEAPLKLFDEKHVLSQKLDQTWRDVGMGMQLVGRVDFVKEVGAAIDALNAKAPTDTKTAMALVWHR